MLEFTEKSEVFSGMTEKTPEEGLNENIGKFLEVYKILSPEARIGFEIEITKKMKDMDEGTRKLYLALVKAAKDELNIKETVSRMRKAK
jgi:hypothetical protein